MAAATGYSIFLIPPEDSEVLASLAGCISEIAQRSGAPVFVPHVTLIGGMVGDEQYIIGKTQKLADSLVPFDIKLGELGSNGTYFQVLFSKIEPIDSLMRSSQLARDMLRVQEGVYFPHLSLAYGDFTPDEVEELKQEILNQQWVPFGETYRVKEIELWNTEGEVSNWRKAGTFSVDSQQCLM